MDAYIGEIRAFPFNFAPRGWAQCNGQQLAIQQNSALFAVIGVTYGGNGSSAFNLPNLNGTTLVGTGQLTGGSNYTVGLNGGVNTVALTQPQLPAHNHIFNASSAGGFVLSAANETNAPSANVSNLSDTVANTSATPPVALLGLGYTQSIGVNTSLNGQCISPTGSGGAHENRAPFVVMNYCIALEGLYPTRN